MLGINKSDQPKLFMVENLQQIKIDSAIAAGEHLKTFASLIGCKKKVRQELFSSIQNNYSRIFMTGQAETVYNNVTSLISESPRLKNNCQI
jgi:hypothetical protein